MKKILAMLMATTMALMLAACGGGSGTSNASGSAPAADSSPASAAEISIAPAGNAEGPYNITVIIKATDSNYWQTLLMGAEAAAAQSGGSIVVTTAGPPSEIDIDQQV